MDGQALVDLQTIIDVELNRLPDKYRRPVVLCYLEGQTQDEAARTLGWTKGTVSGRLRACGRLAAAPVDAPGPGTLGRTSCRGLNVGDGLGGGARGDRAADSSGRDGRSPRRAGDGIGSASRVGSLAREAIKFMLLGRLGRAAVQFGFLALGAAALATPMLLPVTPAPPRNVAGATAPS